MIKILSPDGSMYVLRYITWIIIQDCTKWIVFFRDEYWKKGKPFSFLNEFTLFLYFVTIVTEDWISQQNEASKLKYSLARTAADRQINVQISFGVCKDFVSWAYRTLWFDI